MRQPRWSGEDATLVKQASRTAATEPVEEACRAGAEGLRAITRRVPGEEADLAQDACLKLVEIAHREPVGAPGRLLFRLARNLVIDRLRSQTRAARLFKADDAYAQHPSAAPDPERALLASERLKRALSVIDCMPSRRREAFLLHRVDGFSYLQIAARMGISVKAVEKHISAAMVQLFKGMQENDNA